jgi:hypothetical protein
MNIDLIGSIELTASAAIVIAALSVGFGSNAKTRLCAAFGLSLWFCPWRGSRIADPQMLGRFFGSGICSD